MLGHARISPSNISTRRSTRIRDIRERFAARLNLSERCLRPSAGDHAHEDAILAHAMMIERRADMGGRKAGDGDADQAVNGEKLLRKCAVLGPDRWQLEPAKNRHRR